MFFPGLAYPIPAVLKLLNAQLVFPKVSKWIEPTPEILHCSSCIISEDLEKEPTGFTVCSKQILPFLTLCHFVVFFFFTWFKGTCKNKQEYVEYFS